ncbi:hypothetical protein J6E39_00525 [bacterium]|nr:hypothetical protein [bacterium]
MAESLRSYANSLREYLLASLSDSHNTPQKLAYRYNNLKVYIEPKRESKPHFFVSVGISEVCFCIEDLKKINGNLGTDERYIVRWASKPNINGELMHTWRLLSNAATAGSAVSSANNEELDEKLKIADAANSKVDILGTGVHSRLTRFERSMRRF